MDNKGARKTRSEVLQEIEFAHALRHAKAVQLLTNIKKGRKRIQSLFDHFRKEEPDLVYRFYHQSYKVFIMNSLTAQAMDLFLELAPVDITFNSWFLEITGDAVQREFSDDTNANWLAETLPVTQAFWHAKYFLEQMLVAANELDEAPPQVLPSGWAAVLYLYGLR